jgi:hypothetical protein
MKNLCFTLKENGSLCLSTSNDGSGKCGRHGGLSEKSMKTIEEMRLAGYQPNGDRIMKKNVKKIIKKKRSRDSDGDVIMYPRSPN